MTEQAILTKEEVLARQIIVIGDIERAIRHAREIGSDLLIRQHQYLKAKLVQQLNEMFEEQGLNIKAIEEA